MGSLSALGPTLSLCHSAWARTYESMGASHPLVSPADQASSLGSASLPRSLLATSLGEEELRLQSGYVSSYRGPGQAASFQT